MQDFRKTELEILNSFNINVELQIRNKKLGENIESAILKQNKLLNAILLANNKPRDDLPRANDASPIILGNAITRMSILKLGNPNGLHTTNYIYPEGYSCKRKFYGYKGMVSKKASGNCDGVDMKVYYVCNIEDNGIFKITCGDEKSWEDKDTSSLWNKFKEDMINVEPFCSLEDFFGLTHSTVQRIIEGLVDNFEEYPHYMRLVER